MVWSAGAVLTASQLNTNAPQEWTDYTPAIVNMPLTSVTGAYVAHGSTVFVKVRATASGAVSGTITISLPAGLPASSRFGLSGSAGLLMSNVLAVDSGTTVNPGFAQLSSSSTVQLLTSVAGTSAPWNATVPHTWANTDVMVAAFSYETG